MGRLQQDYYSAYRRQFSLQLAYERWRRIMEEPCLNANAARAGAYDTKYHAKALGNARGGYRDELSGRDSVGQRKIRYAPIAPKERRAAIWHNVTSAHDSTNDPGSSACSSTWLDDGLH